MSATSLSIFYLCIVAIILLRTIDFQEVLEFILAPYVCACRIVVDLLVDITDLFIDIGLIPPRTKSSVRVGGSLKN